MKVNKINMLVKAFVGVFAVGVFLAYAQVSQRPLNQAGLTTGWSFGTALPTTANDGRPPFDGEPYVITSSGSDPLLRLYNDSTASWDTTPMLENTNAWTASNTFGNDETDTYTFQGRAVHQIWREDFEYVRYKALESDDTAAVVTDASVNYLELTGPTSSVPMIGYRIEAPGGPGLAATPAPGATVGVFTVDGYADDVDNEGIQFTFGSMDNASDTLGNGIVFDETNSVGLYCEVQVDIANISAVDDFWFGWALNDATDNPPASADFDTFAGFTLVDATGDVNLNSSLNNAAEGVDDTAIDLVDGDQVILRVGISADAVTYEGCLTDACSTIAAITATNATLNADDGDVLKCVLGFTNAAAESLGLTIEYVEMGITQ